MRRTGDISRRRSIGSVAAAGAAAFSILAHRQGPRPDGGSAAHAYGAGFPRPAVDDDGLTCVVS